MNSRFIILLYFFVCTMMYGAINERKRRFMNFICSFKMCLVEVVNTIKQTVSKYHCILRRKLSRNRTGNPILKKNSFKKQKDIFFENTTILCKKRKNFVIMFPMAQFKILKQYHLMTLIEIIHLFYLNCTPNNGYIIKE